LVGEAAKNLEAMVLRDSSEFTWLGEHLPGVNLFAKFEAEE